MEVHQGFGNITAAVGMAEQGGGDWFKGKALMKKNGSYEYGEYQLQRYEYE